MMSGLVNVALVAALGIGGLTMAFPTEPGQARGMHDPAPRFAAADRRELVRIAQHIVSVRHEGIGPLMTAAGLALVGTPYVAGTLEEAGPERLICNLGELDCVTFVETSLAIARTVSGRAGLAADRESDPAAIEAAFERELAAVRYREDRPEGYASRLHYFSEWIAHNEARGAVREVTAELGGVQDDRRLDFMTVHADRYPRLADPATFAAIAAIERQISGRDRWMVPEAHVAAIASRIREGDILAFVPATEGLDVSHTGLAHRTADGVLRLLHAPDVGKRVQVSGGSLTDYLAHHPKIVGIRVVRPI